MGSTPFVLFLFAFAYTTHGNDFDLAVHDDDDTSLLQVTVKVNRANETSAQPPVLEGSEPVSATPTGKSWVPMSLLANDGTPVPQNTSVKFSAVMAEYIAMTLFVIIGCGSAMGIAKQEGSAWIFQVALTFGLAITSLAYAIGHYSGGQINCAVTLGLVLVGQCTISQGVLNFIAQMLGSLTGAFILALIFPAKKDLTGGLATNMVGEGWGKLQALIGEFMMTFLLVFVVLETATNPASAANRANAPLAIGFAVFLAHSVLIPIDGCSINPTRSFGPAVVAQFMRGNAIKALTDMWIFWVGPLLGAAAAAAVSSALMT